MPIYLKEKCGLKEALWGIKGNANEELFNEMKKFITFNFESYIQGRGEESGTSLSNMSLVQDFAIVPLDPCEFEVLALGDIENVLLALDFLRPGPGQIYFRIPGTLTATQALEKLKEFQEACEQNEIARDEINEEKKPKKIRKNDKELMEELSKSKKEGNTERIIQERMMEERPKSPEPVAREEEEGDSVDDAIDELERLKRPLLIEPDEHEE
jgi:hypothetical protein